jgi:hypothetical protein
MPSFSVTISVNGEALWSAIVDAKNRRDARVKAIELMEAGGGYRPKGAMFRPMAPMKVTVEPSPIPSGWTGFLKAKTPPRQATG